MMHHAVPWGTTLCGATLLLPEVRSRRIIWRVVQREYIVENCCDLLGFKCFQSLLSMQFIQNRSFWTFYCAFYKDILHFLNPHTAPRNNIKKLNKMMDFYLVPKSTVYVIICCIRSIQVLCSLFSVLIEYKLKFLQVEAFSLVQMDST